ncbi:hypothetical protein N2152v2_005632 [Parachlorella kessleri]
MNFLATATAQPSTPGSGDKRHVRGVGHQGRQQTSRIPRLGNITSRGQRRHSASYTEWRAVPRADEENPALAAWKKKAVSTEGEELVLQGPDPLDPSNWEESTQQEWADFMREARLEQCNWWDITQEDEGFPPTYVDLEAE